MNSREVGIDPNVPKALLERQKWFAKTITLPLREDDRLPKVAPWGSDLVKEAEEYLSPSATLTSHQRIEIYHQQYWWRLIKVLQQNFPTLTRFLGPSRFNKEIAIAYLTSYPPTHYALCQLGDTLPNWLSEEYGGEGRESLSEMAQVDFAAQKAFWGKAYPFPSPMPEAETLLTHAVCLQPFLTLFSFTSDLFSFRELLLKENTPSLTSQNTLNLEFRKCYFVVYRTPQNFSSWKEISFGEFRFLNLIDEKKSILSACKAFEDEGDIAAEQAGILAPLWFKEWISLGWLAFI